MRRMSPFCSRLAARHLNRLPDECRHDGAPARWFVQEILWSVWLELADSILGGPPQPPEVRVSREGFVIPVSDDEWADFRAELGCDDAGVAEHAGRLLAEQLLRTPPARWARTVPLGEPLSALVLVLCDLDQRDRAAQRGFGFDGDLGAVVRRHPAPIQFGAPESIPPGAALIEYAGLRASSRSGPLRPAYYSLYKPLRRRLEGRSFLPTTRELPAGLVREALGARVRPADAVPELVAPPVVEAPKSAPEPSAPHDAPIGLGLLAGLLGPVLLARGDPLEAARSQPPELGRRMCLALVEFLQSDGVEWYGQPGDAVILQLPHPDWRLDEQAAAPRETAGARNYKVTRWGLRLYGRVVAQARVTPNIEVNR